MGRYSTRKHRSLYSFENRVNENLSTQNDESESVATRTGTDLNKYLPRSGVREQAVIGLQEMSDAGYLFKKSDLDTESSQATPLTRRFFNLEY